MRYLTRSRLIIAAAVVAVGITAISLVLVGSAPAQPGAAGESAAQRTPLPSAEQTSSAPSGLYPVAHVRRGFRYPVLNPSLSADNASTARAINQAATTKTYIEMARDIAAASPPPPPQASPAFPPIPTSLRTL
jgi:hypothetical protein